MTEEAAPTPNEPKESIFKRARFGFISFAMIIIAIFFIILMIITSGTFGDVSYLPVNIFIPIALGLSFLGLIFAIFGLIIDTARGLSIASLVLTIPFCCYVGFMFYITVLYHGSVM